MRIENKNSFYGGTNIGSGNSAGRDQIINITQPLLKESVAEYSAEPIWRSPITMAVLTWISFIPTIGALFSGLKIFEPIVSLLHFQQVSTNDSHAPIYIILFALCLVTLSFVLFLRSMAKNQTRYPLKFGYALSGLDNRINIEKISSSPCPECGGKLKYYNKPSEWIDYHDNRGNFKKRKVTEKIPVLECRRNKNHFWYVDPAGTKV